MILLIQIALIISHLFQTKGFMDSIRDEHPPLTLVLHVMMLTLYTLSIVFTFIL